MVNSKDELDYVGHNIPCQEFELWGRMEFRRRSVAFSGQRHKQMACVASRNQIPIRIL